MLDGVSVSVVLSGGLALIVNALGGGAAGILERLPGGVLWVILVALLALTPFLFWRAASQRRSSRECGTAARKGGLDGVHASSRTVAAPHGRASC